MHREAKSQVSSLQNLSTSETNKQQQQQKNKTNKGEGNLPWLLISTMSFHCYGYNTCILFSLAV
jgi:hypothetical protein